MEHELSQTQSPFATEPIGRLIVKFAVPSVIALLVNSLYNIVDQIFIGNGVGYLGNGATNIVFPITIIAPALAMMIGNGGAAYLSLKLGEGNVNSAKKGIGNAVTMVTAVSIVLAAVVPQIVHRQIFYLGKALRRKFILPSSNCAEATVSCVWGSWPYAARAAVPWSTQACHCPFRYSA